MLASWAPCTLNLQNSFINVFMADCKTLVRFCTRAPGNPFGVQNIWQLCPATCPCLKITSQASCGSTHIVKNLTSECYYMLLRVTTCCYMLLRASTCFNPSCYIIVLQWIGWNVFLQLCHASSWLCFAMLLCLAQWDVKMLRLKGRVARAVHWHFNVHLKCLGLGILWCHTLSCHPKHCNGNI